jgi:Bifunctional DNA primase/polymerase, N-terminal/AAA domain/Primase C terminal 1 (PriCT-1)
MASLARPGSSNSFGLTYQILPAGLAAALEAAQRGWRVFPAIGKHPRIDDWPSVATRRAPSLEAWWAQWPDANLAVLTGAGSGLWVLDVDPRKGGDDALAQLARQHGPLPETVEAITGSGGRHLYFRHPGGEVRIPNSAGRLGEGLDVRGDGGYVIAPPSLHPNGTPYRWEATHGPDLVPVAPAPPGLLHLVRDGSPRPTPAVAEVIPAGQRHDALLRIAGTLRRQGVTADEMLPTLRQINQARCQPPWPDAELVALARSLMRYTPEQISRRPEPGLAEVAPPEPARAEAARPAPDWRLYDAADEWDFPPLAELIEALLPTKGIVWWGGLPKQYKSLFALYVALCLACRRASVAKHFGVKMFSRILYVAREDPGSRIQARRDDILSAWPERPDRGALTFVIRDAVNLGDPEHVAWLRARCADLKATILILDTWTTITPEADPGSAVDQARLSDVALSLCTDLDGLVIVVDHSRKNRPEGEPLSSADIYGPMQKWAKAEHILMFAYDEATQRLEVFVEGKDLESRRFYLTISPEDSGEEKFTYAGSPDDLAQQSRSTGQRNREAVWATLSRAGAEGLSPAQVSDVLKADKTPLGRTAIQGHLRGLVRDGRASKRGHGEGVRYFALGDDPKAVHSTDPNSPNSPPRFD